MVTNLGKYLLIGAFFCLAVLCFFVGSAIGAVAFIAMGFLVELAFWLGVKTSNKTSDKT